MRDCPQNAHKALGFWVSLFRTENIPRAVPKPHVSSRSRTVTSRCTRAACLNSMISFSSTLPVQTEDRGVVYKRCQNSHFVCIDIYVVSLKDPGI